MPLLPPQRLSTVLPANTNDINLRAMAQSSQQIPAQAKVPHAKDLVQDDVQRIAGFSAVKAPEGIVWAPIPAIAQEQDINAAEILAEVAREQHLIPSARGSGTMMVKTYDASEMDASIEYTGKCPITTCGWRFDRAIWLKTDRDNHIITHFEGNIMFGTDEILCSLPWPNFIEDPDHFFHKIELLKRQVQMYYMWALRDSRDIKCWVCSRNFGVSTYVDHLNDCIVHAVQIQALGNAPSRDHDPINPFQGLT